MLLTVLALHWLVAAENLTRKDNLTSQALIKILDLQRTLLPRISIFLNLHIGSRKIKLTISNTNFLKMLQT